MVLQLGYRSDAGPLFFDNVVFRFSKTEIPEVKYDEQLICLPFILLHLKSRTGPWEWQRHIELKCDTMVKIALYIFTFPNFVSWSTFRSASADKIPQISVAVTHTKYRAIKLCSACTITTSKRLSALITMLTNLCVSLHSVTLCLCVFTYSMLLPFLWSFGLNNQVLLFGTGIKVKKLWKTVQKSPLNSVCLC